MAYMIQMFVPYVMVLELLESATIQVEITSN